MNLTLLRVFLLFCLLVASPAVYGQTAEPVAECASNPVCLVLFERGQQQTMAGKFADALSSFKQAYEIKADPRLLFNIARVMQVQGQKAEAIPYYQKFIESNLEDEAQKAKAREYLAQCEAAVAEAQAKHLREEKEKREHENAAISQPLPSKSEPVYKKGWFWAAVVGGAAAIGLGVGLGVGLANRGPSLPEGINTYAATF